MEAPEVLERVKTVMAETLNLGDKNLQERDELSSAVDDSLEEVEFVIALEEEFGIDIPDVDTDGMLTVGDVVQYILSRTKK